MSAYVIDTNVGIVANGKDCPQADSACILKCIQELRECVAILKGEKTGAIVVDDGHEIFDEYKKYLNFSGQPGVGDLFFKELFQHQMSAACEQVTIHKESSWGYREFPHDPELADFDLSDRKFVAVTLASRRIPTILNATDRDWLEFEAPLSKYINIKQLCVNCLERNR